jgi:DNA helicase HerA-like ATPase
MWLLAELFEELPEAGDLEKPKLVFFFDEAHLLFDDAPKALVEKVEQVVRLIRSKGVGVYFVTQNPADVPPAILGQLGNRVQHALRAFTPVEQKGVRAAAETFRPNPKLKTEDAITQLGVGEALVSTLHDEGVPSMVERTLIRPPSSRIGPATAEERRTVMGRSPVAGRYDQPIDRESAAEILQRQAERQAAPADELATEVDRPRYEPARRVGSGAGSQPRSSTRQGPIEAMITSAARSIGTQIGRQLLRGVLGSLTRR